MLNKYFRVCLTVACGLVLFAGNVYSQNFSKDVNPIIKEEAASEEELAPQLSEEDINKMLMEEGLSGESSTSGEELAASQYTLGANDVIEVTVLRHPEVSGQYPLNNEGKIQYEFVGDINLTGLNKDEATEAIKKKLESYIISPEIALKITEYNSKIVYVIGEVGMPGKVFMRGDAITVREALIRAGLPLLSAKASKSKIITPSARKKPTIRPVNVNKLLYEGDLRENLVMKPGDTLYVPATMMTKVMRVIQPVTNPVVTAAGAGRTVMTGF